MLALLELPPMPFFHDRLHLRLNPLPVPSLLLPVCSVKNPEP
jgi:hypothetical protein